MKIFDSTTQQNNEQPDLIDEVTDNLTYLGFLDHGVTEKCLIIKIETTGTVTTRMFPDGQLNYNRDWDQRSDYTYNFKK